MQISNNGLNLIKKWEGCRLTAYQDVVGVWTIGYGTTNSDISITGVEIKRGLQISLATANEWFEKSINKKYIPKVEKYQSRYNFNQNQIDALTSFAYNIGSIDQLTANGTRTIRQIEEHIQAYCNAGGKRLQGLYNRRTEELELFKKPCSFFQNDSVEFYPKCDSSFSSIVDALKSINVDSSLANRKIIASKNGIENYRGLASQNLSMLKKLKAGVLKK